MVNNYKGMAITIIILSGIHVILSLVFSVMAYRKGLRKEGGAWLLSFGVCVAILVLAAVDTGQKDTYKTTVSQNKHVIHFMWGLWDIKPLPDKYQKYIKKMLLYSEHLLQKHIPKMI